MSALLVAAGILMAALLLQTVAGLHGTVIDHVFSDGVYLAIELLAVTVMLLAARRAGPERAAWLWLAGGMSTWFLGDLVWSVWLNSLASPPYPSVADWIYLAGYVSLAIGMTLLLRHQMGTGRRSLMVDGLIGGLTVAAVGSALIFQPVLDATEGDATTVAVTMAYPLADLLLFAFVIVAFAATGWRPPRRWVLLGAGLAVAGAGDAIFVYQAAVGSYVVGSILDCTWPAAMLLTAMAASRPSRPVTPRLAGWELTMMPAVFLLVASGLLVYGHFDGLTPVASLLAVAAVLLAIVRAALTNAENLSMMSQVRTLAFTDALTALPNRRCLIADLERALEGELPTTHTLAFFDLDGFKHYNDHFGHVVGDELLSRLADRLRRAVAGEGRAYRLGGDEFCILVEGLAPETVKRAVHALEDQGGGFRISSSHGVVQLPGEAATPSEALRLADTRMYAQKRSSRGFDRQTCDVLVALLDERDARLHDHMSSVARLARLVGLRMGIAGEELDVLTRAAELHDVGKVAVPEQVLDKPGPLEPTEWRLLRQHTVIGERILAAAPALRPVAQVVRASHERWDGQGYPDGLAGEGIPLAARIIAVCDAFDAIVSDRVYREARSTADALVELRRCAGEQFDPEVVEIFCDVVTELIGSGVDSAYVQFRPVVDRVQPG